MKLTNDMTLDDFRDEMQHRVVKYPLGSKQVREAVRFARRNTDANFYRVALDKIDAQRQYRHQRYGPSFWQRMADFVGIAPRDAAVTLALVVGALAAIRYADSWLSDEPDLPAEIDVERLAEEMMGFYINEPSTSQQLEQLDHTVSVKIDQGINQANIDEALTGKLTSMIEQSRFDEVAAAKVGERLANADLETIVAENLGNVLDQPTVKQLVADRVDQHVTAAGIKERVLAEFEAALQETKLNERIAEHIDGRLAEFDQQLDKWMAQFNDDLTTEIRAALDTTNIEQRVAERIASQLDTLDTKLSEFDKQLLERAARFQEQIAVSLRVVLDEAHVDKQLSEHLERTLSEFDKKLTNRVAAANRPTVDDGGDDE